MHRIESEDQLKYIPEGSYWVDHEDYVWIIAEAMGAQDIPAERLFTLREAIEYLVESAQYEDDNIGFSVITAGVIADEFTIDEMVRMFYSTDEDMTPLELLNALK